SAIKIVVSDDDGGTDYDTRFVTVSNASPALAYNAQSLTVPLGGTATLLGTYSDGRLDAQSLTITWGDSSAASTFAISALRNAAGSTTLSVNDTFSSSTDGAVLTITSVDANFGNVSFSVQHQYTVSGLMSVGADIADDDLGVASGGAAFFVISSIV